MSKSIRIVTLIYVMACFACTSAPSMETHSQLRVAPKNSTGMTVTEARIALRKSLKRREHGDGWMDGCDKRTWSIAPVTDFVNVPHGVMYTDNGTLLNSTFIGKQVDVAFNFKQILRFGQLDFVSLRECSAKGHFGVYWPQPNLYIWGYSWANISDAQLFVDAVNAIVSEYRGGAPARAALDWVEFQASAKAWRELNVKPALPEETHREKVLAEEALREKNLEAAISHYRAGLKMTPLWPEGQFNVALLHAELGDFFFAVGNMLRYLELVPDASDAQAARDKMIIWQNKVPKIENQESKDQKQEIPQSGGGRKRSR